MMTLDTLTVGSRAKISKMNLPPSDAQRLVEMGVTIGARVQLIKVAPMGDPLEILVRGYHLSLRRAEAQKIDVETTG